MTFSATSPEMAATKLPCAGGQSRPNMPLTSAHTRSVSQDFPFFLAVHVSMVSAPKNITFTSGPLLRSSAPISELKTRHHPSSRGLGRTRCELSASMPFSSMSGPAGGGDATNCASSALTLASASWAASSRASCAPPCPRASPALCTGRSACSLADAVAEEESMMEGAWSRTSASPVPPTSTSGLPSSASASFASRTGSAVACCMMLTTVCTSVRINITTAIAMDRAEQKHIRLQILCEVHSPVFPRRACAP
mmetsp:Transcript_29361/g.56355  ORF Transcript_29361/g.56355 Transcript_29361/m.56355 type:complete len:252 (+) Transcript_29361:769-1524(+)